MAHSNEKDAINPRRVPGATERDILFSRLPDNPESLLHESLFPDDAYVNETYWADLPQKDKLKWVAKQHNDETRREWQLIWNMFKQDPLKPFWLYFRNYAITGLGFFAEGYVLFSVGNLLGLFEAVWPMCWKTHKSCNKVWVQSINYLEIVGIILGQIIVGIIGDWIGRRWGIIQDACIMLLGSIMLTAMWGVTLSGWTICYAISLLVFAVGVGGEYPMTSVTAMEGIHGEGEARADKLHRGRSVLLAFLMQGWGQLINQVVLIVALLVFHGGGKPPYGKTSTQYTFRVSFGFISIFFLLLVYIRVFKLKNADKSYQASRKRNNVTGYDVQSLQLVRKHYWHRLLATSVCWFCNDFPFYGNQIFRNVFLVLVTGGSDNIMTLWLYNLVNIGCALIGYYLAALLIDHKLYGRKRMQMVGFGMSFLLFVIAASTFPLLDKKGPGSHAFEFIYFFSSFWIQFGPNSTTFLLAAEVYPAQVRATAHGFSAAVGKLGALSATVMYNYIGARVKFWVVCWFGLIGFVLTYVFIPDTTGLDLREQERYWRFVRQGNAEDYHGIAVHPQHLSLFERVVLKRDRNYNPELDKQAKIEELRSLYQKVEGSKTNESVNETDSDELSDKVSTYFDWERASKSN